MIWTIYRYDHCYHVQVSMSELCWCGRRAAPSTCWLIAGLAPTSPYCTRRSSPSWTTLPPPSRYTLHFYNKKTVFRISICLQWSGSSLKSECGHKSRGPSNTDSDPGFSEPVLSIKKYYNCWIVKNRWLGKNRTIVWCRTRRKSHKYTSCKLQLTTRSNFYCFFK